MTFTPLSRTLPRVRAVATCICAFVLGCSPEPSPPSGTGDSASHSDTTADTLAIDADLLDSGGLPDEDTAPIDCADADYHVTLDGEGGVRATGGSPAWHHIACCSEDPPGWVGAEAVVGESGLPRLMMFAENKFWWLDDDSGRHTAYGKTTITHDDEVLGGVVEGTFTGAYGLADGGTAPVTGSFRVCRKIVDDLKK